MLIPITLFLAQTVAHLAFLYLICVGTLSQWLTVILVYFFTGCFGMTMTYHRLLAHRSWQAPKWFEYFGTICATLGMTGSAISWVAIHRKHHRFTDTTNDPHSPHHKGFIYCQWFTMFEPVEIKYAIDLTKERFYRFQHNYYFLICLVYCLLLSAIDSKLILSAFLAPACLLWNAGSTIVTVSHIFGNRDHQLQSRAGNSWLLGLLVWGEGWHNNHHHDAKSPYFSHSKYQIDIGGYLIYFLNKFRAGR